MWMPDNTDLSLVLVCYIIHNRSRSFYGYTFLQFHLTLHAILQHQSVCCVTNVWLKHRITSTCTITSRSLTRRRKRSFSSTNDCVYARVRTCFVVSRSSWDCMSISSKPTRFPDDAIAHTFLIRACADLDSVVRTEKLLSVLSVTVCWQ